jgi:hypothetical protein
VLEAQELIGGDSRSAKLNNQTINNGLRFFPATEPAAKALTFLESLTGLNITGLKEENPIETYESSGFKKFVGFGEKSPEFYQQLSYFLNSAELKLSCNPHEWVRALSESLAEKILTKSIVTKFGFENLDSENPKLTHVIVNGTKQLYAQNFIFAGAIKDLGLLLPDDILNARAKAKLKKSTAWQGVCLDLFHTLSNEKQNLFLLNGTTDDDIGPCIGRFLPNLAEAGFENTNTTSGQFSQWMSFIDSELAEDTENIGLVLKKMKRQIKRAFPELAESIKKERIFVTPALSGSEIKLTARGTIPKVDNLWVASAQASSFQNLLGSLMQAQLVLSSLGFMVTDITSSDVIEINASNSLNITELENSASI